jgi:hypothetical protein
MAREKFELLLGHVIIEKSGHRLLVDTGSPISFGTAGNVRVFNRTVHLAPIAGPLDVGEIGRHIGALAEPPVELRLGGLLGTDFFRGLAVEIDWEARTVTTSAAGPGSQGFRGDLIGNLPSARISLGGRTVTAVVDTGARTCFAAPALLNGSPVVGRTRDFYPTFGSFETAVRQVQVGIEGRTETTPVAEANQIIVQAIGAAEAEALVGTDLLQRLGPARFVFPRERRWVV